MESSNVICVTHNKHANLCKQTGKNNYYLSIRQNQSHKQYTSKHLSIENYNNTIIRNKRKFDLESKYWAVQVKKRDNYTCQKCNNKPSNYLVSHHLYSYIKYKSLRYDINNGITLCQNCHQVFHEKFGFFNNTKKQYEEWINE